MNKCEERIAEELDIKTITSKLRKFESFFGEIKNNELKNVLKYSRTSIIDLQKSSEDSLS
jgi:hypothetical protein